MLRESAERFVSRSYSIEGRNALSASAPGFSTAHWATFAELGWLAIRIPEDLGGIGATFEDTALLLEAFGAGLLLEPFTAGVLLSGALLANGAAAPRAAQLLEALGEGTAHVATAYREAADAGDPRTIGTRVTPDGDELIIDGTKINVLYPASADTYIVSAHDATGATVLVLVPRATPGIHVLERIAVDGTRNGTVSFSGVRVPRDAPLALDDAAGSLARALDEADAALCAEAVGVMSRAYRAASVHVRERLQFGRPIAAFQTVRHRIADMYVELELARAAAAVAAAAIDRDDAHRSRNVSMAKLQIARSGRFVCEGSVQLHGAIGIAAEAAPAHALARITAIAATFGDIIFHRNRYLAAREGLSL